MLNGYDKCWGLFHTVEINMGLIVDTNLVFFWGGGSLDCIDDEIPVLEAEVQF